MHCSEALRPRSGQGWHQEVNVSLSDHEHEVLQQMEQALSAQDPKFVAEMQRAGMTAAAPGRIAIAAVGVIVGLGLVLVGVNTTVWLGAAGFALMVASVSLAVTALRSRRGLGTHTRDR